VRLTDAGEAFVSGARATLTELERAMTEARRASHGELGRARIFSGNARRAPCVQNLPLDTGGFDGRDC
jgi:DNA-binding transcriptional LysR family regulator